MSRSYNAKIAKVVHKTRLDEGKSDAAYWRALPYQDRIAALENIREEYHRWKYHAQPGFQRVYSIVKR
jgi:hypothetical protein